MPFFEAFIAAALLAVAFSLLAFRFARVACLHALTFWVFMVGLPFVSAWLYSGRRGLNRLLAGDDLAGATLADALAANGHLYVLYGLGILTVAALAGDRTLLWRLQQTFARQVYHPLWAVLFAGTAAFLMAVGARYGRLVSGAGAQDVAVPYLISSLVFVATSLAFALFCYLAILSARKRSLLLLLLPYCAFLLIGAGRREFLLALATLFVLRGLSVGFRFNWRFAWMAVGGIAVFIVVSPLFLEMREQVAVLQSRGVPAVQALRIGVVGAADAWWRGETGLSVVRENVERRGNAGLFLLSIAERDFPYQHGDLLKTQLQWAVPSVIAEKPDYPVEARIQLLAGMALVDDAASSATVFYADFGALGLFLAGLFEGALLYGVASLLATGRQYGFFRIGLLGLFFIGSLAVEAEMLRLFAELRNLVFFVLPAFLVAFLAPRGMAVGKRIERPLRTARPSAASRPYFHTPV